MDAKYYTNYRTVCRLPEKIVEKIQKEGQKDSGLDYTRFVKNSLKELKQGTVNSYIKWKEDLSDDEIQYNLKIFMPYEIAEKDVIAVYMRNTNEICMFTKYNIYIRKINKYEIYYVSIPLDKVQKIENRAYDGPTVYFEDGDLFALNDFEYKNVLHNFLRTYIKQLVEVKEQIHNRMKLDEERLIKKNKNILLIAAINGVNRKYEKECIIISKNIPNEYVAYMGLENDRKCIYFNENSIIMLIMQGKWIESYVNLNELSHVKYYDESQYWITMEYSDGSKKEITYGSEKTKIMYDFFSYYLEEKQKNQ